MNPKDLIVEIVQNYSLDKEQSWVSVTALQWEQQLKRGMLETLLLVKAINSLSIELLGTRTTLGISKKQFNVLRALL